MIAFMFCISVAVAVLLSWVTWKQWGGFSCAERIGWSAVMVVMPWAAVLILAYEFIY